MKAGMISMIVSAFFLCAVLSSCRLDDLIAIFSNNNVDESLPSYLGSQNDLMVTFKSVWLL
jgi:hypothetical protein